MAIIAIIKAFFAVRKEVNKIREIKMDENKPGWKKTEFFLKLFTVDAPVLWMSIKGLLPAKYAAIIEIVGLAVFGLINTVQKAVENWKSIQQTTETTTVNPAPVSVTTTTPVTP